MRFPEQPVPHKELTERVIAAGFAVHGEHGPGLNEKIYENSLCVEFAYQKIPFTQQENFSVFYREKFVGRLQTDLIVEGKVIVDTKVVEVFNKEHIAQMLSYLNITKLEIGLLLNFKHSSMQMKRVSRFQSNL